MKIKVTLQEIEEVKRDMTKMKPQEVDYIASFYLSSEEIAMLRRHIAVIGDAMMTKAINNPDGVKASTLEALGEELISVIAPNATVRRPPGDELERSTEL